MSRPPADVVVVGLGAAGGTAVEAGLDVVALDAGDRAPQPDDAPDELESWLFRNRWGASKVNRELPTHRLSRDEGAGPPLGPIRMANAVGGTAHVWSCQWGRFPEWSLRARSASLKRYGSTALPARSTLVDWPLDSEELEPDYSCVEELHGVSGMAGNVAGELRAGGNCFEAPRRSEYPLPPLRSTGWTDLMATSASKLGLHPFPGAAAIRSKPYRDLAECTYCGFCGGTHCYRAAKASPAAAGIPEAEAAGLRVVTRARAMRLLVDRDGRATGVAYVREGQEHVQSAAVVLLAAYTYENVRLLLVSTSKAFPRGLANNGGQVGRHFMTHLFTGMLGLFERRDLNLFSGSIAQCTAVADWSSDNFDHSGLGFVGGGMLSAGMQAMPIRTALSMPPDAPRWGRRWKRWLHENARSIGTVNALVEVFPSEENVLDLDPATRDEAGMPVVRCTYALDPTDLLRARFLQQKCREWLEEAGASNTWTYPPFSQAVSSHAYGGTRMGDDPDDAVSDRWGFSHEVPNLGFLGASLFPSASDQPPTATVQALALRTARHLVDDWNAIRG